MLWRLLVIYGLLITSTLALVGVSVVRWSAHFELERLEGELLARARLVGEVLQHVPAKDLIGRVDALALRQPGDVRITVLNEEGKVLADSARESDLLENHSQRPEVLAARERTHGVDLRHSRSVARDLLYVAIRIETLDPRVAFVRVAMSPGGVRDFAAYLWRFFVLAGGIALAATAVVTYYVARRLTRPLSEVDTVARQIAAGAYGSKVQPPVPGELGHFVSSFNRMSEELAARLSELESDQEQLRAILGGMVEGVIALDPEQRVLFANGRAAHLLEFNDAVGRKLWDVVRHRPILDLVERCLTRDSPQIEELSVYGRADRSMSVHAVRLARGRARGAILVIHDISELRKLERLRQEFVANVSHELKTPLTVIKACVETLLDEEALTKAPHTRGFLEQVSEQSDRLHRLILDLLSIARIEAGSELFTFEMVQLSGVVDACLQSHRPRAESRQLTLKVVPPPSEIETWADEEAVAEVLDNLVDNAVKYTPAGGAIEVRWWPQDDWVCLEVADNGIGIPQQDLPRIFERFYRVDKARSRELGGTGLGLSIVKHLVQAMNGTITATSRLGQGSSFLARLPRHPDKRREERDGEVGE